MARLLALCPSRPHRAVLGLLQAATGGAVETEALLADLKRSDPQDLVRIATATYVHVMLSKAFEVAPHLAEGVPADLVIYFNEMRRANLRRNQAIRTQLLEIGRLFSEVGVDGVVLKGGAELLVPLHADPAARFLSDLDILVPDHQLDVALSCLHAFGAVSQDEAEINQRLSHHQEALWHPAWPVPVELHLALGAEQSRRILSAATVLSSARPSGLPGLSVPAPAHRLAHAVLHAQIDPPRYRDGSLSPRDLIEMETMVRQLSARERAEAKTCFDTAGEREIWEALDAARIMLLGDAGKDADAPTAATAWAKQAFAAFGTPGRRRLALGLRLLSYYVRTVLTDRERRRHYLGQLRHPARIARAIRYQKDKFRRLP